MTIRATLKKKLRFVNSMVLLGFVVFIPSCFLESGILALSAFALIFGSIGYLYLGIRCPHFLANAETIAGDFTAGSRMQFDDLVAVVPKFNAHDTDKILKALDDVS